jgi:NAD+ synthase
MNYEMGSLRQDIIKQLGVKPEIDPYEEIEKRTKFLTLGLATSGLNGYVLGISGGQDSLLAGMLAQRAVQQRRADGYEATFHALKLPYGTQADQADVELALQTIGPDAVHTHNIKPAVDAGMAEFALNEGYDLSDFLKGNRKARERMAAQFDYAGDRKAMVIGTDHAAEAVMGFFTKFGDGAADILPLSGLTKRQGRAVLRALGVPEVFVTKAPTADLLDGRPGQADESELGVLYDHIDDYLEGKPVDRAAADIIEDHFLATMHKREQPIAYADQA